MSLESDLAALFERNGWVWKTKPDDPRGASGTIVPDEEDILAVLDEAATRLYNEPVGTRFETGRLIIEKKHRGHDVYVYAGAYD